MSYTKGPWHRNIRADGRYPMIFAGNNLHVAQVCRQNDKAEMEANIDLVSAAPDLLEALKAAKEVVDVAAEMTSCRSDDDFVWGAQKLINAAIEKAEGRE